jgi:SHS family lactate transporter-like MFS transporter
MADTKSRDTRYDDEFEEPISASRYVATRFSTLKPPMARVANPFRLLAMLNKQQWLFFLVGVEAIESFTATSRSESDQD